MWNEAMLLQVTQSDLDMSDSEMTLALAMDVQEESRQTTTRKRPFSAEVGTSSL